MFRSSFILPYLHLYITNLTEKPIYLQSSNTSSQVFILVDFCKDSSLCMETSHLGSFLCCAVLCLVAQSCPILCDPMDCRLPGSPIHGDFPGKNTGVGCHFLHQGIFPIQGSNPGLQHCRQTLYPLSPQGSPGIYILYTNKFSKCSPLMYLFTLCR